MINQVSYPVLVALYLGPVFLILLGIILFAAGYFSQAAITDPTQPGLAKNLPQAGKFARKPKPFVPAGKSWLAQSIHALRELEFSARMKAVLKTVGAVLTIGGMGGVILVYFMTILSLTGNGGPVPTPPSSTQVAIANTPIPTATATANSQITSTPAATVAVKSEFGITLAGLKYKYGEWDPRSINLTTSALDGIPLSLEDPKASLEFLDVEVNIPHGGSGLEAQVEIYAGGILIGNTPKTQVIEGVNRLGDPIFKSNFLVDPQKNALMVLPAWKDFNVVCILTRGNDVVADSGMVVHINSGGQSWFIAPPAASIVGIDYSVDGSPVMALNLQDAAANGWNVQVQDNLNIRNLWVKSRYDAPKRSLHAEGYLTSCKDKKYDDSTKASSGVETAIAGGVYAVQGAQALKWEKIPQDKDCLILSIIRDDEAILDRYEIQLTAQNAPVLYHADQAMRVDPASAQHLDFEIGDDLTGWTPNDGTNLDIWTISSYSGKRSLAVKTSLSGTQTLLWKNLPKNPTIVVGQIFWPSMPGVNIQWALICESFTGQCAPIPIKTEQWNAFSINFLRISDPADPKAILDRSKVTSFFIRADISGNSKDKVYTFFIDDLITYFDKP